MTSEDKYRCFYCNRLTIKSPQNHPLMRTRDHTIPISKGGLKSKKVIACLLCNSVKGNMLPEEWEAYMTANPMWWLLTKKERRKRLKANYRKIEIRTEP